MSAKRKIWSVLKPGNLDRLSLLDDDLLAPAENETTVRVEAVGLNFADVFACLGLYSATPEGAFVPGLEFAGVVEETGERVMGLTRFGAYATRINADTRYLWPLPDRWTAAQGAGYIVTALTAWYALHELGALKAGQLVLVQSAAGGVGLAALASIKHHEALAIGTIGNEAKIDALRQHSSLDHNQVIVRNRRCFDQQLVAALEAAGRDGFDLVLDGIGGELLPPLYNRLLPGGRIVVFGAAELMPRGSRPNYGRLGWQYWRRPKLDPLAMISENRSVLGFNLIWLWNRVEQMQKLYAAMTVAPPSPPLIGHTFPFADAPDALRLLQSGNSVGKIVLEVSSGPHGKR